MKPIQKYKIPDSTGQVNIQSFWKQWHEPFIEIQIWLNSLIFEVKTKILEIVTEYLFVNSDTLFHVGIVKRVKGVESAFCNYVVEKDEASKYGACVEKTNSTDVAHALDVSNIRSINSKCF